MLTKSQGMTYLISEDNHAKIIDLFINPELDLYIKVIIAECLLNISAIIGFRKAMLKPLT